MATAADSGESGESIGERFLQAFEDATTPHPFTHVLRIWEGCIVFEVQSLKRDIWHADVRLGFIQALTPGQGDGTRALAWFLALAREHGAIVNGTVTRKGTAGLTQRQLRAWYKRHGFHVSQQGDLTYPPEKGGGDT